jgi:hypothetical protein
MPYNVKVGGTWRTTSANYVKVSGTWRTISSMWVKVSGTWRQLFSSQKAFTTMSSSYPVGDKLASLFESIGGNVVKACGESPATNLCYKSNLLAGTITWTQGANYPISVQGPFSAVFNSRIYGVGGAVVSSVYSTTTAASSWTTESSLPVASYWHSTNNYNSGAGIMKVCGFTSNVSTFAGTSWTTQTSMPISGAFNSSTDIAGRTFILGSSQSESNTTGIYSTVGGASYTTETSRPIASRRTYASNIDNKATQVGGEATSNVYIYSGTGGTWSVGISTPYTGTHNATTEGNSICYGTYASTVWRYA